jgi:glutathione S-transferase
MRNTHERYPADEKNAKAAESAKKEIANQIRILDEKLAGREYILGSTFTLADLMLAGAIAFAARVGVDTSSSANVSAWVARCMGRPALAKAMQG